MINAERRGLIKQLVITLLRDNIMNKLNMSDRVDRYTNLALSGTDAKSISRARSSYLSAVHFITTNTAWYDHRPTTHAYSLLEYLFAEMLANKLRVQVFYYADQTLVDRYVDYITEMCFNVDTQRYKSITHDFQWLRLASEKLDGLVLLRSMQTRAAVQSVLSIKWPEWNSLYSDRLEIYKDELSRPHALLFPESMMNEAMCQSIEGKSSTVAIIARLTEQYLPVISEHYEQIRLLDNKTYFKYQRDHRLSEL